MTVNVKTKGFNALPVEDRLWSRVRKGGPNECWNWFGARSGNYGSIWWNGNRIAAHRLSWILAGGEIPEEKELCHKCDNPLCVNPEHLFIGSHSENMKDAWNKGRLVPPHKRGCIPHNVLKTHCRNGHPFTPENTYRNKTARICRTCKRFHQTSYMNKRRSSRSKEPA